MWELEWYSFLLILARLTSFFVTLPLTSYRGIPNLVKVFLAFVVAYLIYLSADFSYVGAEALIGFRYIMLLGAEVLTGLLLGFVVLLFFTAFRIAGQFADVKIGFAMAAVFDPQFAGQVTLIGQFYYLLAILVYFAVNGHHHLFLAIHNSFTLVPLGQPVFSDITVRLLFSSFYHVWLVAFQIAAPVIAAILITDISLGLISKTVPQLQVFLVGMPLKVFLGLFVIYLTLPYMSLMMEGLFHRLYVDLINIMESLL